MQPFLVSVRHPEKFFAARFAAKILDTFCSQLYNNTLSTCLIIFIHCIQYNAIFAIFFSNIGPNFLLDFLLCKMHKKRGCRNRVKRQPLSFSKLISLTYILPPCISRLHPDGRGLIHLEFFIYHKKRRGQPLLFSCRIYTPRSFAFGTYSCAIQR